MLIHVSDPLVVDATLNCLSILVRTRPGTSNRILNALLNFNPLKLATLPMSPRTRVIVRSMEKTTRLLLIHLSKRDPHNPMVPRIHQHVERMMRMVAEVFEDTIRKRPSDSQQHDGEDAKRQRVEASQVQILPLGSGPHSLADVFTLVGNTALKSFDVSQLPASMVSKIAVSMLSRLDPQLLARAVDGVRGRLDTLANAPVPELNPNTAPLGVEEDDDDYEPDFYQAEDTEQILNKLDSDPTRLEPMSIDDGLGLKSFSLIQPHELTPEMALSAGSGTLSRVLEMMKSLDDPAGKRTKPGFSRLAASSGSRDSWMTILSRLATRSMAGLEEVAVKGEEEDSWSHTFGSSVRDVLYNYVMEDFRRNIDVAVSWLCEEWYNDKLLRKSGENSPLHYEKCTLRLIDGFLPYLHPQDKALTRFLSEIPELNPTILSRVKHMCRDPSVVQLALTSLLYLVIMRPPVKDIALDMVQGIWTECKLQGACVILGLTPSHADISIDEDARPMAAKYLSKYRPAFLEAAATQDNSDCATPQTAKAMVT